MKLFFFSIVKKEVFESLPEINMSHLRHCVKRHQFHAVTKHALAEQARKFAEEI